MASRLAHWKAIALRRLGTYMRHTVSFAVVGALTAIFSDVPDWMNDIAGSGMDSFLASLPRRVAVPLVMAVFLAVVLRLCTERASDLIRRPLVFVLILTVSTVAASVIGRLMHIAMRNRSVWDMLLRPDELFETWLTAMLWCGLVGWLFLLSLQRAENRAILDGLLGRRAALGRQLAQARLGTARAQFDPAEVARLLSEVHERYRDDPPAASVMLDGLIGQLRRSMQRVRRDAGPTSGVPDQEIERSEHDVDKQTDN